MIQKDLPVIPFDRSDDLLNLDFANSADLVLIMAAGIPTGQTSPGQTLRCL